MADANSTDALGADDLGDSAPSSKKSGGLKGIIPGLLKWILIGVAAVIFIVTIVLVTMSIANRNGKNQTLVPVGQEYSVSKPEFDWYTSLDQINTSTSDVIPASVRVQVALGYKKDDKATATEITNRRIEIIDFLRRFFAERTVEELKPQNEGILKQNIRDQINDEILTKTSIRDVKFTTKDVVQQ